MPGSHSAAAQFVSEQIAVGKDEPVSVFEQQRVCSDRGNSEGREDPDTQPCIVQVAAEKRNRDLEENASQEDGKHQQTAGLTRSSSTHLARLAGDEFARRLDGTQGAEGKVSKDNEDDPERGGELRGERNWNGSEHHDDGPREHGFDQQQRKTRDVLGEDDVAQADRREQIELYTRGVRAEDVVERAEQAEQRVANRSGEQVGRMASEHSPGEDEDEDQRRDHLDKLVAIAAEVDPLLAQAGGDDR